MMNLIKGYENLSINSSDVSVRYLNSFMQTVSLVITHTQHQRLQLFRKALGRGVWPAPLGHSAYMSSHSHLKYITCCCVKKFKTSIPLHYSDLSACIHTTKSIS